jgi:hypothetical protein
MRAQMQGTDATLNAPELTCFAIEAEPPQIVPGRSERDWMDQTDKRYAYRCIPLSMANSSGWEILCPAGFAATWFGGDRLTDLVVKPDHDPAKVSRFATSHFGHGVLTFHAGYIFRTTPGWAIWCRGAPNLHKRRIVPLEGVVETEWLPFPFTMNWRFTRPGTVRFAAGEPFCFITPVAHMALDSVTPRLRKLSDDPQLAADYQAWSDSRTKFNANLAERDPAAIAEGWQRHYVRGAGPQGEAPGFHLSKRKLRKPI